MKDKNLQTFWCARTATSNSINHRRHGKQSPENLKLLHHSQPLKPQLQHLTILNCQKETTVHLES